MAATTAAHSISIISIVFGFCLLFFSTIVVLEFRDKHFKCHGYHDQLHAKYQEARPTGAPCIIDDVVLGSAVLLGLTAFMQIIGAIPAWFNYWKVWSVFQILLLIASVKGILLPFITEKLEGFGRAEDVRILALSAFAGIEFLFAFISFLW